jgi:uncharacterized protein YdaU (DUF1376 family)
VVKSEESRGASGDQTAGTPNHTGDDPDMVSSKSNRPPAFQFYPKDFFSSSSVQRMSMTECGIYITLLGHCWLDGSLPNDTAKLARLCRMKQAQFDRLWPHELKERFIEKNGRLVNVRLDKELRKQIAFRQRQSENGKLGGRPLSQTQPKESQALATDNPSLSPRVAERRMESADSKALSLRKEKTSDVAFAEFRDAYPNGRRKGGHLAEQSFLQAVDAAGGFEALMAALINHKESAQWANSRMIPGMDVWFREERWRQVLPKASEPTSGKTPWPSPLAEWKRIEAEGVAAKGKP